MYATELTLYHRKCCLDSADSLNYVANDHRYAREVDNPPECYPYLENVFVGVVDQIRPSEQEQSHRQQHYSCDIA